jgi:hypothetical protein
METLRTVVPILLNIAGIILAIIGVLLVIQIVNRLRQRNYNKGEKDKHTPEAKSKIIWIILLLCNAAFWINFVILLFFVGAYELDRVSQDQKRYYDPMYMNSWYELKSYSFDPTTVLATIKQGEKDLFKADSDFFADDVYNPGSFAWQQQDFLMVSSVLYEFASNRSLKGWHVHGWSFQRYCGGNPIGFDSARISYLNPDKGEHPTIGEFTIIDINLLNKTVSWGENRHFESDYFFGWQSFDPAKIKITADDALRIADEHGGKEIQQAFQNKDCSIEVSLNPETNLWEVIYFGTNFKVIINANTSAYESK